MSYPHLNADCVDHHALVRDFAGIVNGPRPEIVVLCGSTRFHAEYRRAEFDLTCAGAIVLTAALPDSPTWVTTPEQDAALDELHRRKIDLADRVLVLDVGGYIGDSTRAEIDYAKFTNTPVRYLSKSNVS